MTGTEEELACHIVVQLNHFSARRPAKRHALELALILLDERHKPEDLVRAQHLVAEISARLNAAKVI